VYPASATSRTAEIDESVPVLGLVTGCNGSLRHMARRIEHRTRLAWGPKTVFSTLVDENYLNERLAVLGGTGAAVLRHDKSDEQASFKLRHGVEGRNLPSAVRTVLGGDLTIERHETWQALGDGYTGTVKVTIPGVPGELAGTMALTGDDATGTEHLIDGVVRIPIPFVGGKVEESIVGQLRDLLDAEHRFTQEWLGRHHG
jgi:hypothetical protein